MEFPLCSCADPAKQFLAPFGPAKLAAPLQRHQHLLSILLSLEASSAAAEHPPVHRHAGSDQDRVDSRPERLPSVRSWLSPHSRGVGTAVALSQGRPARRRVVLAAPGRSRTVLGAKIRGGFRSRVAHGAAASWSRWALSSPLFLVSSILHPSSRFPWCQLSRLSSFVAQPQRIQLFPKSPGSLLTFLSLFSTVWEIPAAFQPLSSSTVSRLCFCRGLAPRCPWPQAQSILSTGLLTWCSPELCRALLCERVGVRAPHFPTGSPGCYGCCVFPPRPLPAGFIDIAAEAIMQVCFRHQQKAQWLMRVR